MRNELEDDLLTFYRQQVASDLLPFWWKAVDTRNGGIFTCFDNAGARLVSRNKYTWSQGRFVWLWSRAARMISAGMLPGDAALYLREAERTVEFLTRHVFLRNGNCSYVVSETGEQIEGERSDTSIYADCFVLLGFSEYALAAHDAHVLGRAFDIYDRVRARLASGSFLTAPYPIPAGYRSHSIAMILLRVTQILRDAAQTLGHRREAEMTRQTVQCASEVVDVFRRPDGSVWELIPMEERFEDTVLARHATPGHIFESMWFVIRTARLEGREDWIQAAGRAIAWASQAGWDKEWGGLFRYVDREGGQPRGIPGEEPYERLMMDTWDTKIWWPHSEALYATLLAYTITGDAAFKSMHSRVHEYVFRTFPNPDRSVGEWIQIRDRQGLPLEKCVALPVKDPYHILQDLLLMVELLHSGGESVDGARISRG
ncbi:MAG: AGE family epimerase/isomerase [Bryobacteraceae bacterium]